MVQLDRHGALLAMTDEASGLNADARSSRQAGDLAYSALTCEA